jgi:ABC-type hemin transport system ATPase subunit
MIQALNIADRLHLIDHGRLVTSGAPADVRQQGGLAENFFRASGIGSLRAPSPDIPVRAE